MSNRLSVMQAVWLPLTVPFAVQTRDSTGVVGEYMEPPIWHLQ